MFAARRCAYDLKHAGSELEIAGSRFENDYNERADMWLDIFTPDGTKQYRHILHREITMQEIRIKEYKELLKKHNIPFNDNIPF